MPVYDLYSKRQKKLNGDVSDVYVYDRLSKKLRNQIIYIWKDAIGEPQKYEKCILLLRLHSKRNLSRIWNKEITDYSKSVILSAN